MNAHQTADLMSGAVRQMQEQRDSYWEEIQRARKVLDPEGRFKDLEDAARNRMQALAFIELWDANLSYLTETLKAADVLIRILPTRDDADVAAKELVHKQVKAALQRAG